MSPLTLEPKTARTSRPATGGSHTPGVAPGSEYAGPRTRFRVITRRPLPPPYRLRRAAPQNPLKRALALAGIPGSVLIVYVALWTGAMHGGYYKQKVADQIKALQIENDSLQASLRQLQSPRRILFLAKEMGMKPAEEVEFVDLSAARRVANAAVPTTLNTVAPNVAPRWPSTQRPR